MKALLGSKGKVYRNDVTEIYEKYEQAKETLTLGLQSETFLFLQLQEFVYLQSYFSVYSFICYRDTKFKHFSREVLKYYDFPIKNSTKLSQKQKGFEKKSTGAASIEFFVNTFRKTLQLDLANKVLKKRK